MPTYRIWMSVDSYLPKVPIGDCMRACGLGKVLESNNEGFAAGDIVTGMLSA